MLSVLLHLGYGFVRATAAYPFRRAGGKERFLRLYGPEGLWPLSQEQRRLATAFERCIGCGLCDVGRSGELSTQQLAQADWRSPVARIGLLHALEQLEDADLEAAQRRCPMEVPLAALARSLTSSLRAPDGE